MLERAEAGIYPIDRIAGFTVHHRESGAKSSLSDYYTAAYGRAIFDKSLREHIVFSDHSLATDSVFAEVQFVSCRNVLIYFNRPLQDRAIGLFRDSLCRQGFLGSRLEGVAAILRPGDGVRARSSRSEKIYQKAVSTMTRERTDAADIRAVAIGASAGGVRGAVRAAAGAVRRICSAAVFVVLHLPRDRPSLLVEVFSRKCGSPCGKPRTRSR